MIVTLHVYNTVFVIENNCGKLIYENKDVTLLLLWKVNIEMKNMSRCPIMSIVILPPGETRERRKS